MQCEIECTWGFRENADGCEVCECNPPPAGCDPPSDDLNYISGDPQQCAMIDFQCPEEFESFADECGCGCARARAGCVCPAVLQPVCGVDGNTYNNACRARCANVEIAAQGECMDEVVCPSDVEYCRAVCSDMDPGAPAACRVPDCECGAGMCEQEEFLCEANRMCIPALWQCDREDDCPDGADEEGCADRVCEDGLVDCGDGQCLPANWRCDGDRDCADGRDEDDCGEVECPDINDYCNAFCNMEMPAPPPQGCPIPECVCEDVDCLDPNDPRVSYVAEDFNECQRMEIDCPEGAARFDDDCGCGCLAAEFVCGEDDFQCGDGQCIRGDWVCDFTRDCDNGADEPPENDMCEPEECFDGEVQCQTGECIEEGWVCDGMLDCLSEEDEADCL